MWILGFACIVSCGIAFSPIKNLMKIQFCSQSSLHAEVTLLSWWRRRDGASEAGQTMQRREGWKKAHDSQENSLSQIYFDNSWSHKSRNVNLCCQTWMIPETCCLKIIIYSVNVITQLSMKMEGLFTLYATSNNIASMSTCDHLFVKSQH